MFLRVLFAILMQYFAFSVAVRTWNYEILSSSFTSSDESKVNGSIIVERVRGGSVLTADVDWNFDTDNETEVGLSIYHSQSGRNDDYRKTPYQIEKMKLTEAVNKAYDEMLYKNAHECSNLPKISGDFVPPFPRGKYWFRQCRGNTSGFPDVLPIGYYKVVLSFSGQVDIVLTGIIKLTPKY